MEVSDATEALLQKLRVEQRKLQQTIHFPSGVDTRLAMTPTDEKNNIFANDDATREHHERRRRHDDDQDAADFERRPQNHDDHKSSSNLHRNSSARLQQHQQRFQSQSEAHLMLEVEALQDRVRNLESSLQYERERHQQTRELLRVALKPPPEEQERIHRSFQRDHAGAFIADGPNMRGDDMASILVGAASPVSRIGDVQATGGDGSGGEHVHLYRAPTTTTTTAITRTISPLSAARQGRQQQQQHRHGSINNDGIRLAPFPADGSLLGAPSPTTALPAHCERYEVYGNKVSASRAAQLIYEKAHQMDHTTTASRAVLAEFQHHQRENRKQFEGRDVDDYAEDDVASVRSYATARSRHMTPTPSRPHFYSTSSGNSGNQHDNISNVMTGCASTPDQPALFLSSAATPSRRNSSATNVRPFGVGERRFAPISVFGEQALHRSMFDEGTPRSQVRSGTPKKYNNNSNNNNNNNNKFIRSGASTPKVISGVMTLRSPASTSSSYRY